ncbi:MAG: hypothetical protein KDD35_09205, partial [Bdellovibrionales bacterium]|nr:hypothetical protein [Bdellovibrionales bacterium]
EQKRSRTDTNQMSFIKNQVLLQVFIWLGLHPEVGRVFLQVNEAMKRNLLKQNLVQPSQLFSQFSRSYDTAIGQQEVTEFVFQFDQSEVHQLALYSLRKQILDLLERFFDRPEDRKLLKWTLSLQDLKLWEGLGLVERVDPKSSIQWEFPILPKYSMGNRVGDMRILPVHYRSLSKESKEFLSAQERKSPSWLFFYFENAFYGLSQLRAEDPPTEGPLFKISSDLPTEAKYLSLFITEETARQMAKRLMRPEAP